MLKHLILPVTVVAIQTIASYSRYMRASLLEVKNSEYLRTARSKGITERQVIVRHALRNALIPIVTVAALDIGAIIGGLIITEHIFEYQGMGDYFLTAFDNGDFPQLMPWMVLVVLSVHRCSTCSPTSRTPGSTRGSALTEQLEHTLIGTDLAHGASRRCRARSTTQEGLTSRSLSPGPDGLEAVLAAQGRGDLHGRLRCSC